MANVATQDQTAEAYLALYCCWKSSDVGRPTCIATTTPIAGAMTHATGPISNQPVAVK